MLGTYQERDLVPVHLESGAKTSRQLLADGEQALIVRARGIAHIDAHRNPAVIAHADGSSADRERTKGVIGACDAHRVSRRIGEHAGQQIDKRPLLPIEHIASAQVLNDEGDSVHRTRGH